MHIQRKDALDLDDMTAIATVGAHECLRSGITTIGDCSFSGAAATAAAATGLRAIVYLEVFGRDATALDRFHETRARVEHALSDRVRRRRLAARAVHVHDRGLPGLRGARASPGDALRRERRRARLARRRGRGLEPAGGVPRAAARARPGSACSPPRAARSRASMAAHCVHADAEEIELLATPRRRGRPLPALERLPRLRRRPARGAARGRCAGLDRDGQPRLDALARPLRGDPHRDRRRPGARRAARRAVRRRGARARDARRRPGARPGRPDRLARSRASRPTWP